jgi:hypothetical protein
MIVIKISVKMEISENGNIKNGNVSRTSARRMSLPQRDRTELTTKHWEAQLDILVCAYLNFRMRQGADGLLANPVVDDSAPLIEIETINLFCMFLIHLE